MTKSSHIYTQVCFLEKSEFLFSMTPEVLCVSLLRNSYSLYLQENYKTNFIHFEQDKGKRGAERHLSRMTERAQKSIWSGPIRSTDPPCIWRTHFLYAPNYCIRCALGGEWWGGEVDGRRIQCRSPLSWTVYDLRDFPNGGFSISVSYILQNIHIKSITYSL